MDPRTLWGALGRVAFSLLCAGASYSVWLAAFLLTTKLESSIVEAILFLLAPVLTAAGFTVGILVLERRTGKGRTRFLRIFIWPLIGCAIGAGVVYWFGPMLIVFGMFAAGTVSVALREAARLLGRMRA